MTLSSQQEMAGWLADQQVDTSRWGVNGTKQVADLWAEYECGDSALAGDPPRRAVRVVQLIIERDGLMLLELAQELRDGEQRQRTRQLPSEKLKRGEDYVAGALRCLWEEMAVSPDEVTLGDLLSTAEATAPSPSYPGLPTQYVFYRVRADVIGLPDHDFWRENMAAAGTDPVRRHQFGWRSSPLTDWTSPTD